MESFANIGGFGDTFICLVCAVEEKLLLSSTSPDKTVVPNFGAGSPLGLLGYPYGVAGEC